jgi:aspartate/methionine/tyrosine aminotransferase
VDGNERLGRLGDNPFTRLNNLLKPVVPRDDVRPLIMSIGEPQHAAPSFVAEIIAAHARDWNRYPPVQGTDSFRGAAVGWLSRRYHLADGLLDPARHLLALCGTKEGLFLLAQACVPERKAGQRPVVLMPNPYYQVYHGAGIMSGAEVIGLPATAETHFLPDLETIPRAVLERTALMFLASPANPQGAVAGYDYLSRALRLAREFDFVLAVDECYSEIWDQAPPPGAIEVAAGTGSLDHLAVFHSLSKRSNAAGLRAGFVAGDPDLMARFLTLRTYCGAQMPMPVQAAAAALWNDEAHVELNRARYRTKIDQAERVLGNRWGFYRPEGGFFLWLDVGNSEAVCRRLWAEAALKTLPGRYLGVPGSDGVNPAERYIRLALVHDDATIADAMARIVEVLG